MKKVTSIIVSILLAAVFSFVFVAKNNINITEAQVRPQAPADKFILSAHPFFGKGYDSRPLMVTSVRTGWKTNAVEAVRVRNLSSKAISEFKLGWILSTPDNGEIAAAKEDAASISLSQDLARGQGETFEKIVVSLSDINETYLGGRGDPNDYRLEIVVTEIRFVDGTTWQTGQEVALNKPAEAQFIKASFVKSASKLTVTPMKRAMHCAKQQCSFQSGPPPGYSCASSTNDEYCTNCSTSCCNTVCNDPSPACGGCS